MDKADIKKISKIMKALADENRIRIVCMLSFKKDICVCELTELIGLSQPTISSHLKVLENAGLIESSKEGLWVNYRLIDNVNSIEGKYLKLTVQSLIGDERIKSDLKKLEKTDRNKICRQKK